jgi:SAM-dependent methyltransferase
MHADAYSFCASIVEKTDPFRDTPLDALDVGGANVNGTARVLWPRANWTVLDKSEGDDVDIVTDITTNVGRKAFDDFVFDHRNMNIMVPSQKFDLVICTEVLEHEKNWEDVVEFCVEMLGDGGHLVLTCAGPNRQPHRPDGTHLPNWDSGLEVEGEPYYENIVSNYLIRHLTFCEGFKFRAFIYNPAVGDIYVYGVKKL